ncbi:MAG: hypothetical protein KAS23_09375, partial [Anaerohalosphaera sp.]|nr:hypothetical protein [Anaerohalosphaera sp.]
VTDVGAYSLIATLAVQAGSLVRSIANVLMPVASRMQALGHHEKNARLALLSTKYALVISSGLCILPLLLLRPFLLLWVGGEYSLEYISSLAVAGCVLLFGQWFITTAVCLLQMLTGIGKVKFPAMITLTWAVGGLLCVWTYLTLVGDSLLAVVVIISVARFLGAMASLIYGMIQLDVNKSRFVFKAILLPGLAGLITLAISAFVMHYYNVYEVGTFVCVVILLLLIYVALVWSIVLDPMERSALLFRTKQAYVNLRKKIS